MSDRSERIIRHSATARSAGERDVRRTPVYDAISRRFRGRRNERLFESVVALHSALGRPLRVLDVGGVESFWIGSGAEQHCQLRLLNTERALGESYWFPGVLDVEKIVGTALDLRAIEDVDLVVCNSVIEHVGRWDDMQRCAGELSRVAPAGWVQTPAFGFPIEPHFALPFVHWLGEPLRARVVGALPHHSGIDMRDPADGRRAVEENNLLTRREFTALFPHATIHHERVLGLTKSFVAVWGLPEGAA